MADTAGAVVSIWRYPVKSMLGEELNATEIGELGLLGDRAYALIDQTTGKIISAKHPRKWGKMFDCRAALVQAPKQSQQIPAVKITLPNGTEVFSNSENLEQALFAAFERQIKLVSAAAQDQASYEYLRSATEEQPPEDLVTDESLPAGTFFDAEAVHLLTTATLDQLQAIAPKSRFETRRFRPNLVIRPRNGDSGFVENAWVGRTVAIGDTVQLQINRPCGRCVMTTMPLAELGPDLDILRTVTKHNQGNVGVYASVIQGGTIRRGDEVRVI